MKDIIDARIVVVGLARDCADQLMAVFLNIDRMASCFSDKAYIYLENDSAERTRAYLEA